MNKTDQKPEKPVNSILKYTTKTQQPTQEHNNEQEQHEAQQQQNQSPKQQQNEPIKMAVKVKGVLITDMNEFLRKKKAERDRKFLEKNHPSKMKSCVPPTLNHPTVKFWRIGDTYLRTNYVHIC